ncbi:MAG: hypothetical protein A2142_05930 [candidate division Zixibacteria bacterium RBG_16_48_11]|nr:MAG: hypothetical protein A2142_05930 [candidate division Zixibacteria bacterium RBG_16_48_11]
MRLKTKVIALILVIVASNLCTAKGSATQPLRVSEEAGFQAYQHFVNGDLLELAGNIQSAAEEYKKALQLNPALHEARFHLAQILLRLRDLEGSLEQALQLPLDKPEQAKLVASLYAAKQDFPKAKEYYRRAVELDSLDLNSIFALAQLYSRTNQGDTAAIYLEKMAKLAPSNSQSHQQIAEYYLKIGKSDQAIEEYKSAVQFDSANSQAWAGLALAYESKKDFRTALAAYLKLQSLPTNNVLLSQKIIGLYYNLNLLDSAVIQAQSALSLFPDDLPLKKMLGSLCFTKQDYVQAESVFTSLSQSNPTDEDVILYLGRIALVNKNYVLAETHFQQGINLNDTLLEAWFGLAATYLEQKRFDEAEAVYQECLKKVNDSSAVYVAMGLGFGRAKQFGKAESYFERALQLRPKDAGIILALGNLHQQQGNIQTAEKHFLQVLELEPDNATALNNLGYLWADQGINLEKALAMIGKALEKEPNNPAFLDSYGWGLYKLGRLNEAETYLKRAQEILSTDPEVHHHLGDLYYQQGKLKLAKQSWQKALEIDPDNQKLKDKLKSLK